MDWRYGIYPKSRAGQSALVRLFVTVTLVNIQQVITAISTGAATDARHCFKLPSHSCGRHAATV